MIEKIGKSAKVMRWYRRFYNSLCEKCKNKLVNKHRQKTKFRNHQVKVEMKDEDYCAKCLTMRDETWNNDIGTNPEF